jgi:hypothetical protein
MQRMNVYTLIHRHGSVHPATRGTLSLLAVAGCLVEVVETECYPCAASLVFIARKRIECCQKASEAGADWVLFVDSDISCENPWEELQRQIALDKPILGGKYLMKHSTLRVACAGEDPFHHFPIDITGIHPAQWVGCGWMLIRGDVARKAQFSLSEPGTGDPVPEDVGFCLQHPGEVYFDGDISLHHHFRGGQTMVPGTNSNATSNANSNNDIAKAEKISVIDAELQSIGRRIYQLTLAARFQKEVGDKDRVKTLEDEAVKLGQLHQLYTEERAAVAGA